MVPTPHAEALMGPLRAALQSLERALAGPTSFEPEQAQRRFHVAMLDIYSVSLLSGLLERVSAAGPELSLEVLPLEMARVWELLREGSVELAILGPRETPPDIGVEPLFHEQLVSMVRRGHPLLGCAEIDAEAYARWPHTVFRLTGRGPHPIDEALAELGLQRRIVSRQPYFLAAPALVSTTDLVVTLPTTLARSFAAHWPVELFTPPVGPSSYEMRMAWPKFLEEEGAHQWLRRQMREVGRAIAEPEGCSPRRGRGSGR